MRCLIYDSSTGCPLIVRDVSIADDVALTLQAGQAWCVIPESTGVADWYVVDGEAVPRLEVPGDLVVSARRARWTGLPDRTLVEVDGVNLGRTGPDGELIINLPEIGSVAVTLRPIFRYRCRQEVVSAA